ncbi:hypothetical protein BU23DRAFT_575728 [Bimuria novae-zelandiae CBS 107.79]|uniref:Uncharacterized protein n=1 Tax=Bimuria novae-zelandiae CBS 107.79 TaxID=1447943 RepID=A0A6A5UTE1_9PLEO|nr:hypothetical protein BU23DRAFT_575728 [Bimuria novae-zelandiae CBS 107.79]
MALAQRSRKNCNALSKLQHASLDFLHPLFPVECSDQRLERPDLAHPALFDPLSEGLRLLSYHLRTMNVCLVADGTLFWPMDGSTPAWPNLERLNVTFHVSTPSGSWYFHGLPGIGATTGYEVTEDAYPSLVDTEADQDDDDDTLYIDWNEDQVTVAFRVEPNEATLSPFLTAFAKAAAQMHALTEVTLWCPLRFYVDKIGEGPYQGIDTAQILGVESNMNKELAWGIACTAPGVRDPWQQYSDQRQLWWKVAGWRPNAELHSLLRQIDSVKHCGGLEEHWDDEQERQRFCDRDWFLMWPQRWDTSLS